MRFSASAQDYLGLVGTLFYPSGSFRSPRVVKDKSQSKLIIKLDSIVSWCRTVKDYRMTVQRYLQIQQNNGQVNQQTSSSMSGNHGGSQTSHHRKLDRSLSEPKNQKGGGHQNGQNSNSSRYKTELCRPFEESGVCKYGDKCQFAHGYQELRTLTRHPKYKTELCCTFHTTGLCPYGSRCHFIHNPDENRAKIMPQMSSMMGQPQSQPSAPSQQQAIQMATCPAPMAANGAMGTSACKPLHASLSSPAIGVTGNHGQPIVNQQLHQQNSLRSLSLGSSVGSGSSGELSPSSSPGMFDDPFTSNIYTSASSSSRSLSNTSLFSGFNNDLEMSTLAAAFSAAEGHHGLLKGSPSFNSQLGLLNSSGPWTSPSSELFHFPSTAANLQQHHGLASVRPNSVVNNQQFDGSQGQSSPVNSLTFDFDAISLGSSSSSGSSLSSGSLSPSSPSLQTSPVAPANHSPLSRLPIFNKFTHSD